MWRVPFFAPKFNSSLDHGGIDDMKSGFLVLIVVASEIILVEGFYGSLGKFVVKFPTSAPESDLAKY